MSLSIKQMSEDPWKAVSDKFKIGDKITGKISNITDFGLFVQLLEGVDGLVHISDLSWTDHVAHPSDKYKKGDMVDAVILAIDIDNRKVSLGIKQLEKDPWANVANEYTVGAIIEGTVSKITTFGAFIKLATGIEGLVHISELAETSVAKVEDILKVGQVEKFKVIKVSPEERKLGLSLRALKEPAKPAEGQEKTPEQVREVQEKAMQQQRERAQKMQAQLKASSKPKEAPTIIKTSLQQALEEHAAKMKNLENKEDNKDDK
jgi:small subunit ribosomal protein S1